MKRRRVKITGIGPVTPAGIGREAFWQGILEPVSRVRPYTKLGHEYGPFVAAYISGFDIGKYLQDRALLPKGSARQTMFGVAGALLAIEDANLRKEELRNLSCAIITGSSLMDFGGIGSTIDGFHKRGARGIQPRTVFSTTLISAPEAIGQCLGVTGKSMTVQSSCCSGLDAIGCAAGIVASGEAELAICGGTEAPLYRCPMLELRAAGLTPTSDVMSARIARPFDLWRTTGVVSEGACMFVIEPEESRRPGYSLVSGYAFASDAPDDLCGGMDTAGKLAMADARIKPSDVEAINAWGPGHKLIDAAEAGAMSRLFGNQLSSIPAVSLKGSIGSALGASPAIQMAAAALGIHHGILPPTVNWERPDPACPFNLSRHARYIEHGAVLINAHGLGGVNSSLVLRRC